MTDISHTHLGLTGCSCYITLSANTCHLCDTRTRMCALASAVSFTSLHASWETPFPSHCLNDINNRDARAGRMSSASPLHAGSRLLPATFRCGVCRPTIYSPHPPPVTLYAGKTGEVQSRLIYGMSKRRQTTSLASVHYYHGHCAMHVHNTLTSLTSRTASTVVNQLTGLFRFQQIRMVLISLPNTL